MCGMCGGMRVSIYYGWYVWGEWMCSVGSRYNMRVCVWVDYNYDYHRYMPHLYAHICACVQC